MMPGWAWLLIGFAVGGAAAYLFLLWYLSKAFRR